MFSRSDFDGHVDDGTEMFQSHELAHQWFGDAVTPAHWEDLWLNESFATYGQWLWLDSVDLVLCTLLFDLLHPKAFRHIRRVIPHQAEHLLSMLMALLRRQLKEKRG